MATAVGIDLGTTNSVIAAWQGGEPIVIPQRRGCPDDTVCGFAEIVEKSTVPVLVDLWATWCGPCRMVSPALERLARERAGSLKLVKVDVDSAPAISQRFRVRAVPPLLLIDHGQCWRVSRAPHPLPHCMIGLTGRCQQQSRRRDHDIDIR